MGKACQICKKQFTSSNGYAYHVQNVHNDERDRIRCKQCGKEFISAQGLEYHRKSEHGESRVKMKCSLCLRKFLTKNGLQYHKNSVHAANRRREKCRLCQKTFVSKDGLFYHWSLTHRNEDSRAIKKSYGNLQKIRDADFSGNREQCVRPKKSNQGSRPRRFTANGQNLGIKNALINAALHFLEQNAADSSGTSQAEYFDLDGVFLEYFHPKVVAISGDVNDDIGGDCDDDIGGDCDDDIGGDRDNDEDLDPGDDTIVRITLDDNDEDNSDLHPGDDTIVTITLEDDNNDKDDLAYVVHTFVPNSKMLVEVENSQAEKNSTLCYFCRESVSADADRLRQHLLQHLSAYGKQTKCPKCLVECFCENMMVDHFLVTHGGLRILVCDEDGCCRTFWTQRQFDRHKRNHDAIKERSSF